MNPDTFVAAVFVAAILIGLALGIALYEAGIVIGAPAH